MPTTPIPESFKVQRRVPKPCRPKGPDRLSPLPLEIFLGIISYTTDSSSPKPRAALKTLSVVNHAIRQKCISAGLFQSLLITLQRGTEPIRTVCHKLRLKTIPPTHVHTLTIAEYIIRECPTELAKLLQLLPNLEVFRIKGNRLTDSSFIWEIRPPLNCGRLISFNGILHKTLSSGAYLTQLKRIDILDMSITQIVLDIIVATRRYSTLCVNGFRIHDNPDSMMATRLCNVLYLHLDGRCGQPLDDEKKIVKVLTLTHINRTVRYLALTEAVLVAIAQSMKRDNLRFTAIFPKLNTLHVIKEDCRGRLYAWYVRLRIPIQRLVWRVKSFENEWKSIFHWLSPEIVILESDSEEVVNFEQTFEKGLQKFVEEYMVHQSATNIIYHSKVQQFGIRIFNRPAWLIPIPQDINSKRPWWYVRRSYIHLEMEVLGREEIQKFIIDGEQPHGFLSKR